MVTVEIVGYKKIEKKGKIFYYLSAIESMDDYNVSFVSAEKGTEGLTTYNAFVSSEHLKVHNVPEDLVGIKAHYFNVKNGNTYKCGITFKNYSIKEGV